MYANQSMLKNIRSFVFQNGDLLISNGRQVINKTKSSILIDSPTELQELRSFNDIVIINDIEGNGYLIDEKAHFIEESLQYIKYPFSLSFFKEDGKRSTVVKSLKSELFYTLEGVSAIFIIDGGNYFRKNFRNSSIESFSFPYLNSIWSFNSLSEFNWIADSIYENKPPEVKKADVVKFLGIHEGGLWLVLNSGFLLNIDVVTGTVRNHIYQGRDSNGNSLEDFKVWFLPDVFMDKEGRIISFYEGYYLEYDINNKEDFFLFSLCSDASTDDGLKFNRIGDYDESFVYCWEGGTSNRFGAFNRKDKRIDWSGKIEEAEGVFPAILDVKHQNDKLYVLDGRNTLHILETTNSIRESQINS